MSQSTIADQVTEFNAGFTAQIGSTLSDVFSREQQDLVSAGVPDTAVSVGDVVPDAALLDAAGSAVTLVDALDGAPAVLVFYRGAWCPYCNLTLRTYQRELAPTLRDAGVGLIAISPQTPEGTAAAAANGALEFTVLSDPSATLIRGLGILTEPSEEARAAHTELGFDVADSNADETAGIPFPTVLLIDGDRSVHFADVHADYTTRTEVQTVIAAVEELIRRKAA